MSVETATFISQLVPANPAASDVVSDGATHLRLLKYVLQSTFPNLNTSVTATPFQLNNQFVPVGMIALWYGLSTAIPNGWATCAGQTAPRQDGGGNITMPDLRGRFVVGADTDSGGSWVAGSGGGSATHSHTGSVGSTALSTAQIPSHNHPVTDPSHTHGLTDPGHAHSYNAPISAGYAGPGATNPAAPAGSASTTGGAVTGISMGAAYTGVTVGYTGSGAGHSHTISADSNLPPYEAFYYIMKI